LEFIKKLRIQYLTLSYFVILSICLRCKLHLKKIDSNFFQEFIIKILYFELVSKMSKTVPPGMLDDVKNWADDDPADAGAASAVAASAAAASAGAASAGAASVGAASAGAASAGAASAAKVTIHRRNQTGPKPVGPKPTGRKPAGAASAGAASAGAASAGAASAGAVAAVVMTIVRVILGSVDAAVAVLQWRPSYPDELDNVFKVKTTGAPFCITFLANDDAKKFVLQDGHKFSPWFANKDKTTGHLKLNGKYNFLPTPVLSAIICYYLDTLEITISDLIEILLSATAIRCRVTIDGEKPTGSVSWTRGQVLVISYDDLYYQFPFNAIEVDATGHVIVKYSNAKGELVTKEFTIPVPTADV
jgi:hypothetical protein